MSSIGSVTHWLHLVQAGDRAAAQPLWERYFQLLVARARAALGAALRRAGDEEDVALSAFDSFYRGAELGRFPRLDNRDDLWHLLLGITANKVRNLIRNETRARRGGGKVHPEADLRAAAHEEGGSPLAQLLGNEPTPELAAQVAEEYRRLLDLLGADDLRSIAICQMEGCTVEEIAAKLGRSPRTVARKLVIIRHLWSSEDVPS